MFFESDELRSTLRMIEGEHLDIRTVTMGVSLLSCACEDEDKAVQRVYEKIVRCAEKLVPTCERIEREMGIPIVNKRISVTPMALVASACGAKDYVRFAKAMDDAGKACGCSSGRESWPWMGALLLAGTGFQVWRRRRSG